MFHNRGEYSVSDGTDISLTASFAVTYEDKNKKIPDGEESSLWLEQSASPEVLYIYCKAKFSSSGTVLQITDVLSTSESDNTLPAFTSSSVDVRSAVDAELFNNIFGVGGYDIILGVGQSNMSALGGGASITGDAFFTENATHENMLAMVPHDLPNFPINVAGSVGLVSMRIVIKSGNTLVASSIISRDVEADIGEYDRSSGILAGYARRYIDEGRNNGRPVLILNYALGGTGFDTGIADDNNWTESVDTLFRSAVNGVDFVTKDGKSRLARILIHLGENDAVSENATFQTDMENFIEGDGGSLLGLRASFATAGRIQSVADFLKVPTVLGTLSPDWVNAGKAAIEAALINVPNNVLYTSTARAGNAPILESDWLTTVHLEANALISYGFIRYWFQSLEAEINDGVPLKPSDMIINEATVSGSSALIEFDPSRGVPSPTMHVQAVDTGDAFTAPNMKYENAAIPVGSTQDLTDALTGPQIYDVRIRGENGIDGDWSAIADFTIPALVQPVADLIWPGAAGAGLARPSPPDVASWADDKGNGFQGSAFGSTAGGVTWVTGADNNAVVFNGGTVANYALRIGLFTTKFPYDLWLTELTILARIKVDTAAAARAIYSENDDDGATAWTFWVDAAGVLTVWSQTGASTNAAEIDLGVSGLDLMDLWITVAITINSATDEVKIYVGCGEVGDELDFAEQDSSTLWTVITPNILNDNRSIVGSLHLNPTTTNWPFLGQMADVRIFDSVLSEADLIIHGSLFDDVSSGAPPNPPNM